MDSHTYKENFSSRHIGPRQNEIEEMLTTIGVSSLEQLIDETIPETIRLKRKLELDEPMSEFEFIKSLKAIAKKNKLFTSYIGMGYYGTITPPVIQRNILENPGWYTQYTPYQAEIAQGRLEALLNFQTMVVDLTGLPIANASLLDEGTAAAEAMTMLFNARKDEKQNATKFFVSEECFPQTIDVLKTRSAPIGIELVIGNHQTMQFTDEFFGLLVQYPSDRGEIYDYKNFFEEAHKNNIFTVVAVALQFAGVGVLVARVG